MGHLETLYGITDDLIQRSISIVHSILTILTKCVSKLQIPIQIQQTLFPELILALDPLSLTWISH
jgi:hypothetical protein